MTHTQRHHRLKWFWVCFGGGGLIDFALRDDISKLWTQPVADSVPWLFLLSVTALALANWAGEEAAN